ncbi:MAG: hypothetical protein RR397_04635 [Odoribacter sp.]
MKSIVYISFLFVLLLSGCSVKKNNFFSRNYHQLTTRYNVYFNGKECEPPFRIDSAFPGREYEADCRRVALG